MTDKPWLKQPGELFDAAGVPIYPGDLLKSYHFTDARSRKWYLYHTAVFVDGGMRMVPTSHLEPTLRNRGGECLMCESVADACRVIHGHGPGKILDYTDRPKRIKEPTPCA